MIYIFVLLLVLLLSYHYDIQGNKYNRESWYWVVLILFVFIAGFRWRLGFDTTQYLDRFYHETRPLYSLTFNDLELSDSPLFILLNSLVFTFGGRFYVVQLIHAAFVNFLIFNYFKKHTNYIFTCVLFYAIICYTNYNMEIMRASMGIVLTLYGNDFIFGKKWIKGYVLYFLAFLFHPQFLPYFILPLLFSLKLNRIGILAIFAAIIIGQGIMMFFGEHISYIEVLDNTHIEDKVFSYSGSEKYGIQGGNLYFYIKNIFMVMFYVVFSFFYSKKFSKKSGLLKFEPLIVIGLMCISIRTGVEIAYRYVDCFVIYFIFFYAETFCVIAKRRKKIGTAISYMKALVVFSVFFFFMIGHKYFISKSTAFRYSPYSSIFNRKIDKKREASYIELNPYRYLKANVNEY